MTNRLTELLGIDFPIIQAGMGMPNGLVTTPELVAAVSNAGGLGCIGATGLDPDDLRDTIQRTRQLTSRPISVDLLLPANLKSAVGRRETIRQEIRDQHPKHWEMLIALHEEHGLPLRPSEREFSVTEELTLQQVEAVLEEDVELLVIALGDPGRVIPAARARGVLVAGLAGSERNARRQLDAGVDIVIAQGAEAGGHTGEIGSMVLIPQVVAAASPRGVPTVAAGGIATGSAIAAAMTMGAEGVWCGTVFLFAEEVNIHRYQREQLRAASASDFKRSRVYTGKPSRMYSNVVIQAWADSGLEPLPMPHQRILMDDFSEAARAGGRFDLVSNPAGQVAGLLDGPAEPAQEILRRLVSETVDAIDGLAVTRAAFGG